MNAARLFLPPASLQSSRSLYPHEHNLSKLEVRPLELRVYRNIAGGPSPSRNWVTGAMTALLHYADHPARDLVSPARDLVSAIPKHPPCLSRTSLALYQFQINRTLTAISTFPATYALPNANVTQILLNRGRLRLDHER